MIDKLPTPFGLIRYGVAPDHPEVVTTYMDRFKFFGNVEVGKDISLRELRESYDAVVLAYGATDERALGIKNEHLKGIWSAQKFVNWYNMHPDFAAQYDPDMNPLCDVRNVVVIGHGNVALDIARLLVMPPDELHPTDINRRFVEYNRKVFPLESVKIVGRRGPLQASFSNKELREIVGLSESAVSLIDPKELEASNLGPRAEEALAQRAVKRMMQLFQTMAGRWQDQPKDSDGKLLAKGGGECLLEIQFRRSPVAAVPSASDPNKIGALTLEANDLFLAEGTADVKCAPNGDSETVPCDLLVYSVGFSAHEIPGCAITEHRRIKNEAGKVLSSELEDLPSGAPVFVVGWLKKGPVGNIAMVLPDAIETAQTMQKTVIETPSKGSSNIKPLLDVLTERGVRVTSWADWEKLKSFEHEEGESLGKVASKSASKEAMLHRISTQK